MKKIEFSLLNVYVEVETFIQMRMFFDYLSFPRKSKFYRTTFILLQLYLNHFKCFKSGILNLKAVLNCKRRLL